jgi:hypothetical protein
MVNPDSLDVQSVMNELNLLSEAGGGGLSRNSEFEFKNSNNYEYSSPGRSPRRGLTVGFPWDKRIKWNGSKGSKEGQSGSFQPFRLNSSEPYRDEAKRINLS